MNEAYEPDEQEAKAVLKAMVLEKLRTGLRGDPAPWSHSSAAGEGSRQSEHTWSKPQHREK